MNIKKMSKYCCVIKKLSKQILHDFTLHYIPGYQSRGFFHGDE